MKRAAALVGLALAGCGSTRDDRQAVVVSTLAAADQPLLRARPKLVARKYARMAESPFAFFRGNLPLYARDWEAGIEGTSRFSLPLVRSPGDAHPENFGTLFDDAGAFRLEHNDFDASEAWPPAWDLRRLGAGLVLFARGAAPATDAEKSDLAAHASDVVRAAASAYADAVLAHAAGAPRAPISEGAGAPLLDDLFAKSASDRASASGLGDLSVVEGGVRRLRRGAVETDDPTHVLWDLPAPVRDALPEAVEGYRKSLASPPSSGEVRILDAAREFGSGVSSLPRVRILVLFSGPTDAPEDDWIVELKELSDPPLLSRVRPTPTSDDAGSRVLGTAHATWSSPSADPRWGTTALVGLPMQGKPRTTGARTVRLSRVDGKRATLPALTGLAEALGKVLARSHAASPDLARLADAIGRDRAAFVDEQVHACLEQADRVEGDARLFASALAELGPRLGTPVGEDDAPRDLAAALYDGP